MGPRSVAFPRWLFALTVGFLLGFGLVVSRPTVAHSPARTDAHADWKLPELPDSIMSKHGWTRVYRANPPLMCGPVAAWGCYTYEWRQIQVVKGISRYDEWRVLAHERVHMILGDAHLTERERGEAYPGIDDKIADAIADAYMLSLANGDPLR